MLSEDPIRTLVRKTARRIRVRNAAAAGRTGLLFGSFFSLTVSFFQTSWLFFCLPPAAFTAGFAAGALRAVSLFDAAQKIDAVFGLKERVVTAWEATAVPELFSKGVAALQREETLERLRETVPNLDRGARAAVPVLDWRKTLLCLLFALLSMTAAYPREEKLFSFLEPVSEQTAAQSESEKVIEETREGIAAFAEKVPGIQEFHQNAEELPIPAGELPPFETDRVLEKWEKFLVQELNRRRNAESGSALERRLEKETSGIKETEYLFSDFLRERIDAVIRCRAEIPIGQLRNGENGTESAGRSDKTWGNGFAAENRLGENSGTEIEQDSSEDRTELHLSGQVGNTEKSLPGELPPENGKSGKRSRPGESARSLGTAEIPNFSVPELPVDRVRIPEEMQEVVKKYFDY